MGDLVLGVFRSSQAPQPPDLGALWAGMGDSHNYGYGSEPCRTPFGTFCQIWQTMGLSGPTNPYTNLNRDVESAAVYQNGVSGDTLAELHTRYNAYDGRTNRTFFCFQESGSQGAGQTTAAEFGATWDDFIDALLANTPNCIILTETAFNFRRGPEGSDEDGRDWTDYNTELRARIVARTLPNQIFLCETDRDIKLLETAIGYTNVFWQPNESNPFHFKSVGNLMIALGYFKALGFNNLTLADLADIGTGVVSEAWQQECLDIYNAN